MGNGASAEDQQQDFKVTGGTGPDCFLNLYVPKSSGPGVYHSGLQIGSDEWAFGGGSVAESGIYRQTPKEDPPGDQWKFSKSIPLGKAKIASSQVSSAIDKLKPHFLASNYDVISLNCNHFTEALSKALGVFVNYPAYVNRMAKMGASVGMGKGNKEVEVEEAQTVFEKTKGHSLNNPDDKQAKKDLESIPLDRHGRPNPWLVKK